MTTYKDRAEQYVREQVPELMELSFGCEVWIPTTKNKSQFGKQGRGIVTKNYDGQSASWSGYDPKTDAVSVYMVETDVYRPCISLSKNKIEIIGHPIQLQHWLSAIRNYGLIYCEWFGDEALAVQDCEDGGTDKTVYFNLTTGQPATEADYQAFNDIVGI